MADDALTRLRIALHSGDGATMVTAVREHGWGPSLQLTGEVMVLAVRSGADGATELAEQCADRLGERGWEGDHELAEVLRGAVSGRLSDRPELAIDLDELSGVLEGDPAHGGGRIDLRTGEVWPELAFQDYASDEPDELDEDDPDRWLAVWPEGSRDGYHDMVAFAESREDPTLAAMLEVALDGRGAFRRFKNVLYDYPQDREEWFAFSDDRSRGRARAWLAGAGYRAVPAVVHRHGTIDV